MIPASSRIIAETKAPQHVPEGFGTAIPTNPAELLKFLQQQKAQKQQHGIASRQDLKNITASSSIHSFYEGGQLAYIDVTSQQIA